MEIGKMQTLKVVSETEGSFLLEDMEGNQVPLARIFADRSIQTGQDLEVLVYQDGGELHATTEHPLCEVNEYAVMEALDILPDGAFMDWGIIKDLFIPFKQERRKIEEGKRYLVYVFIDEETGLLTGTTRFKKNQNYENLPLKKGEEVKLIIAGQSELGWNVVVNQKYLGLIYADEVFKKLYPLSEETGYIKEIREDGKIDVTLQPTGFAHIDVYKEQVLAALNRAHGTLYLTDKSTPEEVKRELEMSKKNFKKAIGNLYKEEKIKILPDRIILR